MGIVQRLLDTAQMRTQYPEWLCKEMEAAAEEITRLQRIEAEARKVCDQGDPLERNIGLRNALAMNGANA